MILLDINFYIGVVIGGLVATFVVPMFWKPKK